MVDSTGGAERFAIGLGSNVGDRLANLRAGLGAVAAHATDLVVSAVYETEPVLFKAQDPFLNACCVGSTRLTPRQLLSDLQDAERRAGRRRGGPRFGPRELDLDVLLYGNLVFEGDGLTIPHPRIRERAFVLVPLAEIAADWTVPASGDREAATVAELAEGLDHTGIVRTEIEL
jgi:2-amino-4-hydroxy-6-hydroxymethyldihydropteridine diphosphokinase